MAILGLTLDFTKKEYKDFISDAEKISENVQPGIMLLWLKDEPKFEKFSKISDSYFRSCFLHKKEEYSEISLKWAQAFFDRIQLLNIKMSKEHSELFAKISEVFYGLYVQYDDPKFIDKAVIYKKQKEIFQEASKNYLEAKNKIDLIVSNFGEISFEKYFKDAEELSKLEKTGLFKWYGERPKVYEESDSRVHNRDESSDKLLNWMNAFADKINQNPEKTEDKHLDILHKMLFGFARLINYYEELCIKNFDDEEKAKIFFHAYSNFIDAYKILLSIKKVRYELIEISTKIHFLELFRIGLLDEKSYLFELSNNHVYRDYC